jgi:hypothetical protein
MGNTFLDQEAFIVSFRRKIIKMISNFCVGMICNPSLRNTILLRQDIITMNNTMHNEGALIVFPKEINVTWRRWSLHSLAKIRWHSIMNTINTPNYTSPREDNLGKIMFRTQPFPWRQLGFPNWTSLGELGKIICC